MATAIRPASNELDEECFTYRHVSVQRLQEVEQSFQLFPIGDPHRHERSGDGLRSVGEVFPQRVAVPNRIGFMQRS